MLFVIRHKYSRASVDESLFLRSSRPNLRATAALALAQAQALELALAQALVLVLLSSLKRFMTEDAEWMVDNECCD